MAILQITLLETQPTVHETQCFMEGCYQTQTPYIRPTYAQTVIQGSVSSIHTHQPPLLHRVL